MLSQQSPHDTCTIGRDSKHTLGGCTLYIYGSRVRCIKLCNVQLISCVNQAVLAVWPFNEPELVLP